MKLASLVVLLTVTVAHGDSLRDATWRVTDDATPHATNTLKLDPRASDAEATCTVTDTTGGERAVTLSLCLPLDASGGAWWDDPEHSRRIEGNGLFSNLSDRAGGIDNSASLYPFAVVAHGNIATCLAVPLDEPRMVRFVYDAAKKELRAGFDFGLSPVPLRFPSRANAKVMAFEVPADHAFRRAIAKYWELFPQLKTRRAKSAGNWLPFAESGPIKDARDFGFAFHEIAESQASVARVLDDDIRIGCGSYVYIEPPTYWQQYAGPGKGTYEQRRKQLEDEAKSGSTIARATIVSGVLRDTGRRDLYLDPVAYTSQQPWGSSADPDITDPEKARHWPGKGSYDFDRLSALIDKEPKLAGVYVDSMEGWGELLDYDREHWRVSKFPLTFDPMTKKVALLNFWGTVSWVKKMSDALHGRGKPLMGNDAFFRRWQLAAWVDVPGREYTWTDDAGKFKPVEDERYFFLRTMSGRRPYLMLMNNRFNDTSIMEPYFQRSVFWAVWPSMFSGQTSAADVAYFDNPAWYNRDRELFKKYLPMVRRLDEAGWQPVTAASIDPADARIERYGSFQTRDLAFTIHNAAPEARELTVTLSRDDLHPPEALEAREWFTDKPVDVGGGSFRVRIPGNGHGVVSVTPSDRR